MAGFNTPVPTQGPITTTGEVGRTHEGATGYVRDAKSELFLAAVTSFNEDTFYEKADERLQRIRPLVAGIATTDPTWMIGFVGWLRREANLRSIPIALAAEAVHARLEADLVGYNRDLTRAALLRADEPPEFLGYWMNQFGKPIPSAVKRGLNDELNTLNEYGWLKWKGKGDRAAFSLTDVINLTRTKPDDAYHDALFKAVIADSYDREFDFSETVQTIVTAGDDGNPVEEQRRLLPMYEARTAFQRMSDTEKRTAVRDPEFIRLAGLTHETIAGALGKIDAETWRALIPTMGFQALLMNLRRFDEAGIDEYTRAAVRTRLRDPEQVAKSRMYPMRFLSAYRNAPLEYAGDLEVAANLVLNNVPVLPGRSLILVDRSGSMNALLSNKGTLKRVDAANVFGAALALRAQHADLVAFGTSQQVIPFRKGESLLRLADVPANMGGTDTHAAVTHFYRGHDRIILLTDEQAHPGRRFNWATRLYESGDVFDGIPADVPTFTWNLGGYRHGHAPDGGKRFTFGGLNDKGMDLILALEKGFDQGWPWEAK